MANESKNRVKLNKEYRRIGSISKTALAKVNEYFEVPADATDIRSNTDNMLKHNKGHLAALEKALDELGITKEGYAERLADLERMTLVWEK